MSSAGRCYGPRVSKDETTPSKIRVVTRRTIRFLSEAAREKQAAVNLSSLSLRTLPLYRLRRGVEVSLLELDKDEVTERKSKRVFYTRDIFHCRSFTQFTHSVTIEALSLSRYMDALDTVQWVKIQMIPFGEKSVFLHVKKSRLIDVKADLIQELSEQMDLQLEEDAIQLDGATTYVSLTDQQAEKVKEQVNKQNEVTGVHLLGCPAAITFLERPNTDKKDDSFRVIIKATAEKAIADLSAQIMKTLKLNETDCQVQTETEDTVFVSIHDPLMVNSLLQRETLRIKGVLIKLSQAKVFEMVVLGATTSEALKVALKETLDEVDFSSIMRLDIFDQYAYIMCINSNVRDILREDGGIWINGEKLPVEEPINVSIQWEGNSCDPQEFCRWLIERHFITTAHTHPTSPNSSLRVASRADLKKVMRLRSARYKGVKFTFQAKELEAAPGRFTEYSPARPAGRFSEDYTTQLAGRFSEDSTVQKAGKEIESTTVRLDIMERKWVDSNHEKVQRIFTEENVKAEMNDRGYVMSGTESEKKRAQEKLMKTMSELTHLHIPNMLTDLHATILKDFMNQLASKHSTAIFYSQPKSSHMVQYGKISHWTVLGLPDAVEKTRRDVVAFSFYTKRSSCNRPTIDLKEVGKKNVCWVDWTDGWLTIDGLSRESVDKAMRFILRDA
ncbi:hypothetical protein PROFUN_08983 [Planoprotostelium fungivorum]|uniref:Uncharacterized protein n=1 Tax=Planoprotostelium fungivorum TaxID=1890364 RepID=A0A2P6NIK4_9EUKA|nr:hypothetical protein PROFUN_08983 [Planoprotostelium fungivorum]